MGLLLTHDTPALTREEGIAELREELKQASPAPCTPSTLRLDKIERKPAVFQHRDCGAGCEEYQVRDLAKFVKATKQPLTPITVWWGGKHWYVINGHHRLAAYWRVYKEKPKLPLFAKIPVQVFKGTLEEAVAEAVESNSKNTVPMYQHEKSNAAWRLVCLSPNNEWSANTIAAKASVGRRNVFNMRRVYAKLIEMDEGAPIDMTWDEARRTVDGLPRTEWNHDAKSEQWFQSLKHQFGKLWQRYPETAARAIQLLSASLPTRLMESEAWEEDRIKMAEDWAMEDDF